MALVRRRFFSGGLFAHHRNLNFMTNSNDAALSRRRWLGPASTVRTAARRSRASQSRKACRAASPVMLHRTADHHSSCAPLIEATVHWDAAPNAQQQLSYFGPSRCCSVIARLVSAPRRGMMLQGRPGLIPGSSPETAMTLSPISPDCKVISATALSVLPQNAQHLA